MGLPGYGTGSRAYSDDERTYEQNLARRKALRRQEEAVRKAEKRAYEQGREDERRGKRED